MLQEYVNKVKSDMISWFKDKYLVWFKDFTGLHYKPTNYWHENTKNRNLLGPATGAFFLGLFHGALVIFALLLIAIITKATYGIFLLAILGMLSIIFWIGYNQWKINENREEE